MEIVKIGTNKNALIVDDEKDLREVICYDFEKKGFTVFTSANGNEAIEIIKNQKIDVVLSDIQMPECDGICLLKKISLITSQKPIFLLMSGFSHYRPDEVEELGALKLLSKPLDRKEMFHLIEEALKNIPKI